MRIAIIGSNGQLGTDLVKVLAKENELVKLTHREIEVSDYSSCLSLKQHAPDVVINTAAFHKTDACEDDPLRAFTINSMGPRNLSLVCREMGATVVFISTDYVFSGSKNVPYVEGDCPDPLNAYGVSKLAGELFTRQWPRHYVCRVASLFGSAGASGKGGNFVETMMTKARKGEPISVIDDIVMSPTYTMHAAELISSIISNKLPYGIYHATNSGCCTWFEFTKEIFSLLNMKVSVSPIKSSQYPTKAKRPPFSALSSEALAKLGAPVHSWQEGLSDYLKEKGYLV
jgi:dTDP-4-dehydrorhamnose reductase